MRMTHTFAAARPVAQHCRELTQRGPRPEERAVLLSAWRRDLARILADELSGLLSGDRLDVAVSEPEALSGHAVLERIGPVAANSLLRVAGGETVLASFDLATATALTDRSFGGEGKPDPAVPDRLPRSAALLVDEIAATIAQAISRAGLGDHAASPDMVAGGEVILRSESAARLKPFNAETPALLFTLVIANRQGCQWQALVALAAERMERLLPVPGRGPAPSGNRKPHAPADPMAAPFSTIPLPLHVVLTEIDLPLVRLQNLAPGDTLPLAMGRQVPLMLGDRPLAHGSIGTLEDRMAIRLTRFPPSLSEQGRAR